MARVYIVSPSAAANALRAARKLARETRRAKAGLSGKRSSKTYWWESPVKDDGYPKAVVNDHEAAVRLVQAVFGEWTTSTGRGKR